MIKKLKRKAGYALVWVLCILVLVSFASMALISSTILSANSTQWQHDSQQAYFTAKSAASTVANYIIANASNATLMSSLVNSQPVQQSADKMGTYSVSVAQSGNRYIVSATAKYNNQTATTRVNLVQSFPGIIPTDKLIYVDGDASTGFGQCNVFDASIPGDTRGGVFINGNMVFKNGSSISGNLVVKGTTTFSGGTNSTKDIYSFGSVNLLQGAVINGSIYTKGDIKTDGGIIVNYNAYADGSLTMLNGTINGNAVIKTNASFSGGPKIKGTLTYGGTVSTSWGTITSFVPLGATKNTNIPALDFSQYEPQALTIIPVPTISQNAQLYNPVIITNNTISDSGTINSSVVSTLNSKPYGTTITIDTSVKDINLLLSNTNLNTSNGLKIEVNGTHNAYLYMTGSSNLYVNANEYLGMKIRGSNPKLYIIGDGAQTIYIQNNSELNACVYLPKGTVNASGSPLETYKFIGSCIVGKIIITNDVSFKYSPPDVKGTPLDIFGSNGGASASGYYIEGWN